ncbi:hypothetical protein I6J18_00395 [Peribacillus psychrosaccharolyticus]|uniref:Uncharacterized protein n=1 Tax=Peribacillus psychrosaccharolyticus TaxID=1407 RepID=A0A974NM59_PERPY|nr:hypothetical protein [Peribacillus psychrosaccharolyticus]MEC2056386.1 hypothetical protein [Peribacillus psychrosaccharolyticus]MED3743788.1 hypothetical protein [Peribacillus psychrosaccharolyticus]QQT00452.1 hypothetical protein I6J18_00395 [Peribacillus psychrosaccharolyticus]
MPDGNMPYQDGNSRVPDGIIAFSDGNTSTSDGIIPKTYQKTDIPPLQLVFSSN